MLAIILAGGKGERLRPITETTPKPLIPVQGTTLVELVFAILKQHGVDEVIISIGYLAEKIQAYFTGRDTGLRVRFLVEPAPRGTAGPLLMLREASQLPAEDFFLVNADNLYAADLTEMVAKHREHGAAATVALHEVEHPSAYGVARLDGDRITEFVEKPSAAQAPSRWINSGYAVVHPKAFAYLPNAQYAMYETDLYPALAKAGLLYGYRGHGQWFDTGTHESYARVQAEWQGVKKDVIASPAKSRRWRDHARRSQ